MQQAKWPKLNLNCHILGGRLGRLGRFGGRAGLGGFGGLVDLGGLVCLGGRAGRHCEMRGMLQQEVERTGWTSSSLDQCRCSQSRSSWTLFGL